MADLDDFFAKKDRKKGKSKKFATPDELAKKLEDTTKKAEIKVRKEPQPAQSDGVEAESGEQPTVPEPPQEDEWRDFEEEERKDYTGLKIGNLQMNDDDDYSGTDGDGGDNDGDDMDGEHGAWKKMDSNATNSSKEVDSAAVAAAASKKKPTGAYVPPAMKQSLLQPVRLKKDALPDINNEEYFPTLGDAKKEELRKKKNEPAFEEVKHGRPVQRSTDLATNAPVSVGNRYNSLYQDS